MSKDEAPKAEAKAEPTPPSGQGGKTPKSRADHQDAFPPNPEPGEAEAAYAKKVDEMGNVAAAADTSG